MNGVEGAEADVSVMGQTYCEVRPGSTWCHFHLGEVTGFPGHSLSFTGSNKALTWPTFVSSCPEYFIPSY